MSKLDARSDSKPSNIRNRTLHSISSERLDSGNDRWTWWMLTFGQFDNRKGATWHCIVGRNFGSFVTHGMIVSSACYGLFADSKFRNKAFHILLSRPLCNLTVQDSVRWMNLGRKDISVESKVMGVRRNLCLFAFCFWSSLIHGNEGRKVYVMRPKDIQASHHLLWLCWDLTSRI